MFKYLFAAAITLTSVSSFAMECPTGTITTYMVHTEGSVTIGVDHSALYTYYIKKDRDDLKRLTYNSFILGSPVKLYANVCGALGVIDSITLQ